MDWYRGPTLLDYLEQVDVSSPSRHPSFRMPIQWVNRPSPDFRGYSGLITSGEVHCGMQVRVLPSGYATRIARIVTYDGDLDRAVAGDSVTLTFTDDIDASRGELIAAAEGAPAITGRFSARVFWMDRTALAPGRSYRLKLATTTATAKVDTALSVIDLDTQQTSPAPAIDRNEVGTCTLVLDREIAADRFADAKETGSFILIDPESFDTIGMGCIDDVNPVGVSDASGRARQVPEQIPLPGPPLGHTTGGWRETHARSLAKAVSWRATGSLDTFLVAFVVTGSPKLAGSVAITEILTKVLIYYFHERLWALVPWGKR
jgi:sulfate adenylyltransferase subunit 1 (EFTu-like GTPase family)/uncharacterized membrane protein